MDWLEEQGWKIEERMQDMSLRGSLICYITLTIVCVLVAAAVTINICAHWENLILQLDKPEEITMYYFSANQLPQKAKVIYQTVRFIQNWCVLLYAAIGMVVGIWMFYRHKLEGPIEILIEGAKEIGKQNLDICCVYESQDEMGDICRAFEQMRLNLVENRQEVWNLMEEQRRVNSAFAHDLRTPLTVIRGYVDFLNLYYESGKLTQEQVRDYLHLTQEQIGRILEFIKTMKQLTSLEDIQLQPQTVTGKQLKKQIEDVAQILSEEKGIQIVVSMEAFKIPVHVDFSIVMEVLENLLSNSLSYAKKQIEINLEQRDRKLYLYVKDDGRGFTKEELKSAQKAYYTGRETGGEHFGIGLYICSLLCKKHGGLLDLGNSLDGGAYITAIFSEI